MAGDASGQTKGIEKKKLHRMNPRRRLKLKKEAPGASDQPLTDEEKIRRAEQKKRRVRQTAAAAAVPRQPVRGCCVCPGAAEGTGGL
jgi:hypothetical protein